MAKNEYNINLLYKEAFGYVAPQYPQTESQPPYRKEDFVTAEKYPDADVNPINEAMDLINFPMRGYYAQMTIIFIVKIGLVPVPVPLPNAPLISVSGSNNIVTTQIAGRKGTVKELINTNDHRITIKGMLTSTASNALAAAGSPSPDDLYPFIQVGLLKKACTQKENILVVNPFLLSLGITRIVVESYDFPDMEGFPGVQPYTINAVSDDDPKLDLIG